MKVKSSSKSKSSAICRCFHCIFKRPWILLLILGLSLELLLYHAIPEEQPQSSVQESISTATRDDNSASTTTRTVLDVAPAPIPLRADFPREPIPRPSLPEIVQGWNITGNPDWLLNLAIVGFPKTGTSTLMHYLHKSPQIHVFDEERCEMEYNQHAVLIKSLYRDMPPGNFVRGIKCPRDLEVGIALKNYQTYFPSTDFMVGLRHPIEWFESFYNFRCVFIYLLVLCLSWHLCLCVE